MISQEKGVAVAIVHTGYLRKQNMDGSFETEHKNGELAHPIS